MGYSANSAIIYGFQLSEKDAKRDELWDIIDGWNIGGVDIKHSGHAGGEMHSACIGVTLATGDEYGPCAATTAVTPETHYKLFTTCIDHDIEFKKPELMLITWIA